MKKHKSNMYNKGMESRHIEIAPKASVRIIVKNILGVPNELPYDGGTVVFSPKQQKVLQKDLIEGNLPKGFILMSGEK